MRGSSNTTPTDRTRPSMSTCRSHRPNGSPPSRPSSASCCRCGSPRHSRRSSAPPAPSTPAEPEPGHQVRVAGGAVELDKVVPVSGNMSIAGQQFWLGPQRAGQVVRFWIDCDMVHLRIGGTRMKTRPLPTSASTTWTGSPPGPVRNQPDHHRCPPVGSDDVVEVERVVAGPGPSRWAARVVLAAEILAGRRVGVRIEANTLVFFDLADPRTAPHPAEPADPDQARAPARVRPTGPPPRPSTEPIRVQRRASNTGIIMVAGQQVALGRGTRPPDRDRAGRRDHSGGRARRRRRPRLPPHHHPAGA